MYAGDWEGSFTYLERKLGADGLWEIGVYNTKDFKVSLTLALYPSNEKVAMPGGVSRIVALKITKVWVSEPFFETGPTGAAPKQGIIWLPTDPPTNASNPSQKGMGFQISFPNGSFLNTNFAEKGLDVTADGETLSCNEGFYPNQEIAWEALPPPDSQGKYPSSNVYYWRHLSWTLTKKPEGEYMAAIKKELKNASIEDLVKAKNEILQYGKDYWVPTDADPTGAYYNWRSQVRANQSLREQPPVKYEGYEFLGRSIIIKAKMWAEHVQAYGWADYPAEEMMHRVEGEMVTKDAILVKSTITSDHYRRLK